MAFPFNMQTRKFKHNQTVYFINPEIKWVNSGIVINVWISSKGHHMYATNDYIFDQNELYATMQEAISALQTLHYKDFKVAHGIDFNFFPPGTEIEVIDISGQTFKITADQAKYHSLAYYKVVKHYPAPPKGHQWSVPYDAVPEGCRPLLDNEPVEIHDLYKEKNFYKWNPVGTAGFKAGLDGEMQYCTKRPLPTIHTKETTLYTYDRVTWFPYK